MKDQIAQQLERIFAAIDTGEGIHGMMRADESVLGRRVVVPGDEPWLSADDWDPTVVVSIDGQQVRLIAILARNPGNSAFRRTVAGIQAAGLTPCVVCPSREMRETLKRWGWRGRHVGDGFGTEERWYPRKAH